MYLQILAHIEVVILILMFPVMFWCRYQVKDLEFPPWAQKATLPDLGDIIGGLFVILLFTLVGCSLIAVLVQLVEYLVAIEKIVSSNLTYRSILINVVPLTHTYS